MPPPAKKLRPSKTVVKCGICFKPVTREKLSGHFQSYHKGEIPIEQGSAQLESFFSRPVQQKSASESETDVPSTSTVVQQPPQIAPASIESTSAHTPLLQETAADQEINTRSLLINLMEKIDDLRKEIHPKTVTTLPSSSELDVFRLIHSQSLEEVLNAAGRHFFYKPEEFFVSCTACSAEGPTSKFSVPENVLDYSDANYIEENQPKCLNGLEI
ncbi:uncharacterized protein LOC144749973 [Ciona intestinalis]